MAERRMFAKTIVLSDAFLDMPMSARCLYFTLGMFADDDGFVNSPRGIMRQCGASDDDLKVLLAKKFLLAFDSGVIVIKHWRINNYLRSDRYTGTKYIDEKSSLSTDENGAYTMTKPAGIPGGIPSSGIPRLGKDRLVEVSEGKDRIEEDKDTLTLKGSSVCATDFDVFWAAYPRKKNKEQARKAFQKLKGVKLQELLDAIERQKHSRDWTKDGGQYIPYPATWLNAGGWQDEDMAPAVSNGMERYAQLQRLMEETTDD